MKNCFNKIRPEPEPIIINSAVVRVDPNPFVSTNLQTIIFPTGNKYESAQTADGVLVKMKLMITYRYLLFNFFFFFFFEDCGPKLLIQNILF